MSSIIKQIIILNMLQDNKKPKKEEVLEKFKKIIK